MAVDDPSRKFILKNLGLPRSSFINCDLEFQSAHEIVNENIIDFWKKYLIKQIPTREKLFYVDVTLLAYYEINTISSIKEWSDFIKYEIFGFSL